MAIEVVQQVLGHGSLQTTAIYVNADNSECARRARSITRGLSNET
ncbi:hypothetical protein [Burkholderia gladioli]|nr:hypothetical protein [Burkholderia gladioli]KAF1065641.1 hypothetical protein LvStA_00133 [Burkholderia gladioli]